ncbi:zf-TFIIB domain-containing protein [Helicobacter kayseriensis]|uniref:TFIIB-type zinc ribbon-containing protein n=1 Tax=Helicobacter kayseriensis TaxID=2905877 RepID=UPI001E60877D|nr:zf-TFIIB domain-containing protein [Helicobacter kayseriensis]MCE3047261.1 zf-TFIIB domain-containing protein [Helicobacter kayseriensis]MCE3048632.1 zf-TFIIB domain-containing protein [Helicobacter kayseriensis]
MKCPVCIENDLLMSERSGVEIDYCPKCRGVWLDRGELDKIIANSESSKTSSSIYDRNRGYESQKDYDKRDYGYHKPKKRESFLSELFDF